MGHYGYNDKGEICVTGKGGTPLTEQEVSEAKSNPVYARYQYREAPKVVTAADLPEVRDAAPVRDELVKETEITNKSTDGKDRNSGATTAGRGGTKRRRTKESDGR